MKKSEKRLVGISIGSIQGAYGHREALRIAKEIGADAVEDNSNQTVTEQ